MNLDVLFVAKNRLEFTRQSLLALDANTDWGIVRRLWICDDGSTDGTTEFLAEFMAERRWIKPIPGGPFRAPAAVMNAFVKMSDAPDLFAKIDNDVIVPAGWLNSCIGVMYRHPELDLLGIEPPWSRTPHFPGGRRSPAPELNGPIVSVASSPAVPHPCGYASCESIGGIGLMRTRAFLDSPALEPHSIYGGFTEWQLNNPAVKKGWIAPPLNLFLLDRLPIEPWVSLSKTYIRAGWQRAWTNYPENSGIWSWWNHR